MCYEVHTYILLKQKMKALICHRVGPYGQVLDIDSNWPVPSHIQKDELLIQVAAAGLAFPEILRIEGKHVHQLEQTPCAVGKEFSGTVVKSQNEEFSEGSCVIGIVPCGAYAEFVKVHVSQVMAFFPKDKEALIVGAGIYTNYGTTYHALVDRGQVKEKERVLILGASGGCGLAAVDICKALGLYVVACASGSKKLRACKDAGADFCVDYTEVKNMRKEIEQHFQSRQSIDVIYDPVGGMYSEEAIRMLRFGGRHLVIGFASGATNPKSAIPKIPMNLALLGERSFLGVLYGEFAAKYPKKDKENMKAIIKLLDEGKLNPFVSSIPLENYLQGMDDVMNRRIIGKLVYTIVNHHHEQSHL